MHNGSGQWIVYRVLANSRRDQQLVPNDTRREDRTSETIGEKIIYNLYRKQNYYCKVFTTLLPDQNISRDESNKYFCKFVNLFCKFVKLNGRKKMTRRKEHLIESNCVTFDDDCWNETVSVVDTQNTLQQKETTVQKTGEEFVKYLETKLALN
jgi:hypothetical protein